MSSESGTELDQRPRWRGSQAEGLEMLRNDLSRSRLASRRVLDSLPESDRQYLLEQVAAALDLKTDTRRGGARAIADDAQHARIDVVHSSPTFDLPADSPEQYAARLQQLEMQLEACIESLARAEEKQLEAEIRADALSEELGAIVFSRAWKFTSMLNELRLRLAPRGSWRERTAKQAIRKLRDVYRAVRHPPIRELPAYALGFVKARTPSFIARAAHRRFRWIARLLPDRVREYLRITLDLAVNLRSPLWTRLNQFLDQEVSNNPQRRVAMFYSGTTFTESEGQRPTRLARELARRGVPVIFCYWRWKTSEPPQVAKFPHVFCLPIDEFLKAFDSLLSDPRFAGLKRALVMEFPHPALLEVVNYANAFGWQTVYDTIDDWEEFHRYGQACWYDRDFEAYLTANADVATITCETMREKLEADQQQRCRLLPNAFEDWQTTPAIEPRRTAIDEKADDKITIGYFGHLTSSWFDWPLVVETARHHPEWTFQIIGYGMDGKIESLPNIVQLGKIEHSQLPSHARNWDVAMIPFQPSRLSAAVDPIKIYEYIALQLPTVVTGMPHLASYPGVFTAEGQSQFEEAIAAAAAWPLDEETVREFLDQNRWSNRIDDLLALLDEHDSRTAVSLALAAEF
jgi:hypothetical protein